jgi:hypothetical protein
MASERKTQRERSESAQLLLELTDTNAKPLTARSTIVIQPVGRRGRHQGEGQRGQVTRFRFELPAGDYVLQASARGYEAEQLRFELKAGQRIKRRLALRAENELRDEGEQELLDRRFEEFARARLNDAGSFDPEGRERALEQKARMLEPEALNAPLKLTRRASPIPRGSFGSLEQWFQVAARRGRGGFTERRLLVLGYDKERLGWVSPRTLRLFAFDRRTKRLRLVSDSGVDLEHGFVWGYIDQPGVYGIVGLPEDSVVRTVVDAICRAGGGGQAAEADRALLDRLCRTLLCVQEARDLTPPGGFKGDACDFCRELKIAPGGLPECQLVVGPAEGPAPTPPGGAGPEPLGPPAPTGPCQWISIGPRNINGRIRALAVHPTVGGTVFAGTANAGVWATTDAGQTWAPLMFQEGALEIGALATHLTDPANPAGAATLYAGTGEPTKWPGYKGIGVLKSTASGAPGSWTATGAFPAGQGDRFSAIAVDPSTVSANPAATTVWAGSPAVPGGGPGGLFKSTNGGGSWSEVKINGLTKSVEDIALDPTNPATVYVAVSDEGIYRFDPATAAWSTFNAGLAMPLPQLIKIAIGQHAPHKMYAKLDQAVYRYDNATNQWISLGSHGGNTYGYWNNALAVDPQDSDIVVAAGYSVERSYDAGGSWQTPPVGHEDQHAITFDPGNHLTIWIGNDGGVFRGTYASRTDTGTWSKRSYGLTISHLNSIGAAPGPGHELLGSGVQDNGTIRTTGGLTWNSLPIGGDGSDFIIDPAEPLIEYGQLTTIGVNSRPYKSSNGGQSFALANGGFPDGPFVGKLVLDPNSPVEPNRVLFAAGSDQKVYRTINSAGSWAASSPALGGTITAIAVAPSASAIVYAATSAGHIWRSSDGGATQAGWVDVTVGNLAGSAVLPGRMISSIAVSAADPNTVYIGFAGFSGSTGRHVYKAVSADGFAHWSWTDISSNLPNIPVNAVEVHRTTPSTMWVGTDTAVFQTTTGGLSWAPFDEGFPNVVVMDLKLNAAGDTLRAAAYGYSAWERSVSGAACPTVEIYVRDNKLDNGRPPSPSGVWDPTTPGAGVWWWESVDIKVDTYPYAPAPTDGIDFDQMTHENPVVNDAAHPNPNRLYVQIANRGPQAATNVKVKALWADATMAVPPLPSDFWATFPNTWTDPASQWHEVDPANPFLSVAGLKPQTPAIVSWQWTIPTTAAQHTCMLVVISSDQDSPSRSDANPDDHLAWVVVPADDYVTQKNLTVENTTHPPPGGGPAGGGAPIGVPIEINNPGHTTDWFDIVFDHGDLPSRSRVSLLLPALTSRGSLGGRVPAKPIRRGRGWWKGVHRLPRGLKHELQLSAAVALDPCSRRLIAQIPGILLAPEKPLRAALVVDAGRRGKPGAIYRCALLQAQGNEVVGGNTLEVRIRPAEVVVRAQ